MGQARRGAGQGGERALQHLGHALHCLVPPMAIFVTSDQDAPVIAGAQQELGQALVKMSSLADLLPLVENRNRDAVDRPVECFLTKPVKPEVDCTLPGLAERLRVGPDAEPVGAFPRHADIPRGGGDARSGGELMDEGDLLLRRPAVGARADGDGAEIG